MLLWHCVFPVYSVVVCDMYDVSKLILLLCMSVYAAIGVSHLYTLVSVRFNCFPLVTQIKSSLCYPHRCSYSASFPSNSVKFRAVPHIFSVPVAFGLPTQVVERIAFQFLMGTLK